MIFALCFFVFFSILSTISLYFSVKKGLILIKTQEELIEELENCVQELEQAQLKIEKKMKIELFSDEPIIKELVNDMKHAKETVQIVVEKLTDEKEFITSND